MHARNELLDVTITVAADGDDTLSISRADFDALAKLAERTNQSVAELLAIDLSEAIDSHLGRAGD